MKTFGTWFHSVKDHPARITYICGKETVLVEEILEHTTSLIAAGPLNTIRLDGSDDIWNEFNQFSLDPSAKLFIVREAQLIADWVPLETWFSVIRLHAGIFIIFVSNESRVHFYDDEGKKTKALKPHLKLMKANSGLADIVVCNSLNRESPKDKYGKPTRQPDSVLWLQSMAPKITPLSAEFLMSHVGGDLCKAKDVCFKISLFDGDFSQDLIKAFVTPSADHTFVGALLRDNKSQALLSISHIPVEHYSAIVGSLDYHISMLGKLNWYHRNFKTPRDAMCDKSIPNWITVQFWDQSRRWDTNRRSAARRALAATDSALGPYPLPGWLHALVALW